MVLCITASACVLFTIGKRCGLHQHCILQFERMCNACIFFNFSLGLHQHCIPQFEGTCNACPPAGEVCLSEMGATAEASLDPMAIPTSAAARAARSLMPSPQYMHVFPKPYIISDVILKLCQSSAAVQAALPLSTAAASTSCASWMMAATVWLPATLLMQ